LPLHPTKELFGKSSLESQKPQNILFHIFQVFGSPEPFAIFAEGKFAPNEVRRFSKRVPVGSGVKPLRVRLPSIRWWRIPKKYKSENENFSGKQLTNPFGCVTIPR
jgi:hypothetical protein